MKDNARIAGVFYLLTFVSIPTVALYGPVHDEDYVTGTGSANAVVVGAVVVLVMHFIPKRKKAAPAPARG